MLKPWAMAVVAALVFVPAACQTTKSRHACQQDVERLKGVMRETGVFFEALEPELREASFALQACDSRTSPCRAEVWLTRLEQIRLQESELESRFARAVDVYEPDACLRYSAEYRLNPPDPETYMGYFATYEQAEDELDRLIRHFRVFAVR